MKNYFTVLLLSILLFFPNAGHAEILATEWQSSPEAEGSQRLILSEYNPEKNEVLGGLNMKFTKTWHTYWKHPGDSGLAHKIDFSKSENISSAEIIWPAPTREIVYDMEAWVYKNDTTLPIKFTVIDNAKPAKINLGIKWAICDENCLFEEDNFTAEINPATINPENKILVDGALDKSADPINANGLEIKSLKHLPDNALEITVASTHEISKDADLFIVEDSKNFRFPKPAIKIADDGLSAVFTIKYEKQVEKDSLNNKKIEASFVNNNKVTTKVFEVSTSSMQSKNTSPSTTNHQPSTSIIYAILAALLGGLILNIMPCVLPVLSIKIMSVIKLSGADKTVIRKSFLFTILGIISSFLILAVITIILKQTGKIVGWGTQFQHPAFLMLLVFVLTIFTANLFGFFEFSLSDKLSDKLYSTLDKQVAVSKTGSFLTGAFATLLATPCTAPFLATAITFALSQSALQILYIFFFMGVGLALPYILVFISPSLVKIFPKPGKWMVWVKKIMAIFLLVTIFWLIFVMGNLVNFFSATSTFATVMCLFWLLWYVNRKKLSRTRLGFSLIYVFIISLIAPIYFFQPLERKVMAEEYWQPFSKTLLEEKIAENKIILVDVTADWCLTCQFNKKRVIYPMLDYLQENNVIGIKADFTQPNLEISKFLESYKAYGIPFNVVYGPAEKGGIVLPVLLTEDNVKQAIKKAKGE